MGVLGACMCVCGVGLGGQSWHLPFPSDIPNSTNTTTFFRYGSTTQQQRYRHRQKKRTDAVSVHSTCKLDDVILGASLVARYRE